MTPSTDPQRPSLGALAPDAPRTDGNPNGVFRIPQDVAGGIALIALGAFALFLIRDLPVGQLRAMGPGMLPRALAVLVAFVGVLLVVTTVAHDRLGGLPEERSPPLERWSLRGLLFVLSGIIVFGLTVRGFSAFGLNIPALGLLLSGPLLLLIGSLASPETKWREIVLFAVVMTAFCVMLFKVLLGLPVPFAPWWDAVMPFPLPNILR